MNTLFLVVSSTSAAFCILLPADLCLHITMVVYIGFSRSFVKLVFIHSFILLACAECYDSLPFSGASSIPLCYVLFPATLLHQLFFHLLSPHLVIYFLLFPNSYIMSFWEFYFLPFSLHAQTNVIYLTLLCLL